MNVSTSLPTLAPLKPAAAPYLKAKQLSPLRVKKYKTKSARSGAPDKNGLVSGLSYYPAPDPTGLDTRYAQQQSFQNRIALQQSTDNLFTELLTGLALTKPADGLEYVAVNVGSRLGVAESEVKGMLDTKRVVEALVADVGKQEEALREELRVLKALHDKVAFDDKYKVVFVVGCDGSVGSAIASKYGYAGMSVGEAVDGVPAGSALSEVVDGYRKEGLAVPDSAVVECLAKALRGASGTNRSVVIHGDLGAGGFGPDFAKCFSSRLGGLCSIQMVIVEEGGQGTEGMFVDAARLVVRSKGGEDVTGKVLGAFSDRVNVTINAGVEGWMGRYGVDVKW